MIIAGCLRMYICGWNYRNREGNRSSIIVSEFNVIEL